MCRSVSSESGSGDGMGGRKRICGGLGSCKRWSISEMIVGVGEACHIISITAHLPYTNREIFGILVTLTAIRIILPAQSRSQVHFLPPAQTLTLYRRTKPAAAPRIQSS